MVHQHNINSKVPLSNRQVSLISNKSSNSYDHISPRPARLYMCTLCKCVSTGASLDRLKAEDKCCVYARIHDNKSDLNLNVRIYTSIFLLSLTEFEYHLTCVSFLLTVRHYWHCYSEIVTSLWLSMYSFLLKHKTHIFFISLTWYVSNFQFYDFVSIWFQLHKWELLERYPVLLLARRTTGSFVAECHCPWQMEDIRMPLSQ